MSLSFHDVAVPSFRQGLSGLSWVLAKASAHFVDQGRDTSELMVDRLAEDMQPFAFQVGQAVSHSQGALERLTGKGEFLARAPASLDDARLLVSSALAAIDAYDEAAFANAEVQQIVWSPIPAITMNFDGGQRYLIGYAIPNFYFHCSVAYAIARKNGVPIGKRDFMARGDPPTNL